MSNRIGTDPRLGANGANTVPATVPRTTGNINAQQHAQMQQQYMQQQQQQAQSVPMNQNFAGQGGGAGGNYSQAELQERELLLATLHQQDTKLFELRQRTRYERERRYRRLDQLTKKHCQIDPPQSIMQDIEQRLIAAPVESGQPSQGLQPPAQPQNRGYSGAQATYANTGLITYKERDFFGNSPRTHDSKDYAHSGHQQIGHFSREHKKLGKNEFVSRAPVVQGGGGAAGAPGQEDKSFWNNMMGL